jgi:hypothetical protein
MFLQIQVQQDSTKASSLSMQESLLLLETMLSQIPHIALLQRPELTSEMQEAITTQRPYIFACSFYKIQPILEASSPSGSFTVPFGSVFEGLARLSMVFAQSLCTTKDSISLQRQNFSRCLSLIEKLISRLDSTMRLAWDPKTWLSHVLESLKQEVCSILSLSLYLLILFGFSPPTSLLLIV